MGYVYHSFDGVGIPRYNRENVLDTAEAMSGFVPTPNGGFDTYGASDAPVVLPFPCACSGVVFESSPTLAQAVMDGLRSRRGAVAELVRLGDDGEQHRTLARLMRVAQTRDTKQNVHLLFTMFFEAYKEWSGLHRFYDMALSTIPVTVSMINNGNRTVRDAVVTIQSGEFTISQVELQVSGKSHIRWNGGAFSDPLAPGEELVFDMGSKTVRKQGEDAYFGFSYQSGHTINDWIHVPPGGDGLSLTFTNSGSGDVSTMRMMVDYYEGWK